jgi:hypothetical protein
MARQLQPDTFKSISEIINNEKTFSGLRDTARNYNIVEDFSKIFPDLSIIVKAVKVEKQVLFLKTDNSVWKNELNFQKNLMVEKINNYFKEQIIKTIKFL